MSRRCDASWSRGKIPFRHEILQAMTIFVKILDTTRARVSRQLINYARSSVRDLATTWRVLRATQEAR